MNEENIYNYPNGDYKYTDNEGTEHLLRDSKEIAKGKDVCSYNNGNYRYTDNEGTEHLMRDGKEITKGKDIYLYDNRKIDIEQSTKIVLKNCVLCKEDKQQLNRIEKLLSKIIIEKGGDILPTLKDGASNRHSNASSKCWCIVPNSSIKLTKND